MFDFEEYKAAVEENGPRLRAFLEKFDHTVPEDLHLIVEEVDKKVWETMDCTECARCCHVMTPTYNDEDIARISAHLEMSQEDFIEEYLEEEEDNPEVLMLKELPCRFLKDNKCTIYEVRPDNCKSFPYHHMMPFDEYTPTFIQNIEFCPATYLLISGMEEKIKKEYDWE